MVVSIVINKTNESWVIYPNPAHGEFNLFANEDSKKLHITIFDAAGRVVHQQTDQKVNRGEKINVNVTRFAAGIYTVRIEATDRASEFKKILVN